MLSRNTSCGRYFASYAICLVVASHFYGATSPLFAQSADVSDSTTPAAPTEPNPAGTPATAAVPPPQSKAASAATESAVSTTGPGAYSAAAGPAPVSGPGAPVTPILGDHIGSAYTSERVPFRITAALGEVYADNIFAAPHKEYDYITRLSARGEYQAGNLLSVDGNYLDALYNPSLHLYVRHPHENGVDQDVDVLYAHHFSRLTLSLEQIYTSIQTNNASVGGLVTADEYTTLATAKLGYSPKLDFIATFKQEFVNYDSPNYTDTQEWSGEFYSLYHLDDRLSFGIGPRLGYLILQNAPDEHYEQFVAHVIYVPNEKLTAELVGGAEDRQYQTSAIADTLEPIFEFKATYLPFPSPGAPGTVINLDAAHRFTPSYNFAGQDYLATNVHLDATQRFLRNYYVEFAAGYENDDYQFIAGHPTGPSREDNIFYLLPSVSWKPNAAMSIALFDKYEEDDSNVAIFAYDANQLGLTFSATY